MLDLFLIILLIISIFKPDIMLSKKTKEKASEEQKHTLAKNYRKIFGLCIATIELNALRRYVGEGMGIILLLATIVVIILFFVLAIPAIKENRKINKELE